MHLVCPPGYTSVEPVVARSVIGHALALSPPVTVHCATTPDGLEAEEGEYDLTCSLITFLALSNRAALLFEEVSAAPMTATDSVTITNIKDNIAAILILVIIHKDLLYNYDIVLCKYYVSTHIYPVRIKQK